MKHLKTIKEKISHNIRCFRELNKLTQKQLAEKLGVKHNAISSWESGTNAVDIEILLEMCKIFGVTINEMYGIENKEKQYLSPNEMKLIKSYRTLTSSGKESIDKTISNLLEYERNLKIELENKEPELMAAHNDDNSEEQQELMKQDLEEL
ncbi:DNA-binding transcriptional regulator, XRE-family HTH domain [Natronincola peptidivorans]|uniref:DNA-binding transcriptional regulator, XRE-family HTH domain n=1 Tax=Natronincola peptidivorans TaxID=426128 RepID=A0A1I0FER1_9FIRM|nr:helix-turn-helix transcriptional regulator [Natronincola peptidivorans]SET56498.1 DNA-binding transcriptional regulator, XRE-family HTH domain [Natronincola peptidivorans]